MKITFFSNFLNHHQTPFCDEMYKILGSNFTFVSTEKIPELFLQNGYPDCTDYIYNLNSYLDEAHYQEALKLGMESDVVMIGSAPNIFIDQRLKENKHTFRISERLLKKGKWQLLNPRFILSLLRNHTRYRNHNFHMLCASAFTAKDLGWVFAYPKKKYKWGYFTRVEILNIERVISQKPNERVEIIWVGRFIGWKHPELAVQMAYEFKNKGYNFHLNMIGTGELVEPIQRLIDQLGVSDFVSLLGSIPNSEVKNYMLRSNIFIFTSDQNEGWGAVLNEAMSCGCAVVASDLIGSVPYLIANEENGLIFKSGSLSSLCQQAERILEDQIFRDMLSFNAYQTLAKEWSPESAACNFMLLAKSIFNSEALSIENGPCSKAESA
jgi:glycosyltransferase involved in cell wall biosynthesis